MKKKKGPLILTGVLVILLIVYFGLSSWNKKQDKKEEKETVKVTDLDESTITAIKYQVAAGEMSFEKEGDTWYYSEDKDFPLKQSKPEAIVKAAAQITADRKLEDGDSLDAYGLDDPNYSIEITEEDGTVTTVSFGDSTGTDYYVTVGDTGTVYTVASSVLDDFKTELSDFAQLDEYPSIGSGNLKKEVITENGTTTTYDSENEEIVVGNDWLSRTVDADTAGDDSVRVLIHEKLHSQINNSRNPKQFREKLRTIYDDFVKAIDADLANLNDSTFDEINARFDNKAANIDTLRSYLTHIKEYQFEKFSTRPDTQLEEFIVESLTSKGLMDYLNSVKVEGEHKAKANTLWQKIMEFISRLFGIEIRDESLRAKEFNLLANKFKENKVTPKTEVKEETKSPVEGTLEFKEDETKPEEKVPEEIPADDNISNITEGNDAVNEDDLDDLLNMGSSVDDKTLSNFSSLYSAVRALPMEEQSRMLDMVERGEFSISCR